MGAAIARAVRALVSCTLGLAGEYLIGTVYLVIGISAAAMGQFDSMLAFWVAFATMFLAEAAVVVAAPVVAEGLGPREARRRVKALWKDVPRRRGGLSLIPLFAYLALLLGGVVSGRSLLGDAPTLPVVCALAFALTSAQAAVGAAAYVNRRGVVDGAPASALAAVFE
jgi:hypothetical protein